MKFSTKIEKTLKISSLHILLAVSLIITAIASCSESTNSSNAANTIHIAGQRIVDYETARKVFWKKLYNEGGETLYCGRRLTSSYNKGVNIEHVFPASWMAYSLRCGKRKQCRVKSAEFNFIEADLHNLYPSRSDVNKARSNYRFAMIRGEQRSFDQCDFEFDERQRIAEPSPAARGRIARAMLYMSDQYDLYLKKKLKSLLVDWDRKHPPEQAEYLRNDRIEQIQGNRNSFIDAHQ
ncbi:MAG: endonuclease [Pseudomonadota bacterium]|nr:endonuclease [Pseudomonadota bacterium]